MFSGDGVLWLLGQGLKYMWFFPVVTFSSGFDLKCQDSSVICRLYKCGRTLFAWGCFLLPPYNNFCSFADPSGSCSTCRLCSFQMQMSCAVSEKERFRNSDCCPCLRGLGDHWLGCSFCGKLRAACPFLLVTPSATPDQQRLLLQEPQWWCQLPRYEKEITEKIKQWEGDWVTSRTPFQLPQNWNLFFFLYTNWKSVQVNEICLFRWKSRTDCSTPLWGVSTCSHFHLPACVHMRSLSPAAVCVQGRWGTWRWASRSQSNRRSRHEDWMHQHLIPEI